MNLQQVKEKAYKKKKGLPWYGTHITHPVSIRIVALLQKIDISPDILTFLTVIFGVISAVLFTFPSVLSYLAGALMLQAYYVFDAVDGQYARLKGKTSLTGAYFDYISNHIVDSLVFLGMGLGLFRSGGEPLFMVCGFFSAWGMIFMYLIHDAQASVLMVRQKKMDSTEKSEKKVKVSLPKRIFMIIHGTCTYPAVMNIITILAFLALARTDENLILFKIMIIYYTIALNFIWMTRLAKRIIIKELDTDKKGD